MYSLVAFASIHESLMRVMRDGVSTEWFVSGDENSSRVHFSFEASHDESPGVQQQRQEARHDTAQEASLPTHQTAQELQRQEHLDDHHC